MGRYGLGPGSMMGASGYGWMRRATGYVWMMGGTAAPGWMTGGTLPGFMMGGVTDPGKVMGALFADAPGSRVGAAEASRLGDQVPAGATTDRAANRITSAVWFLGESTSAGMQEATLSSTASAPGDYQYPCPIPGHARDGMVGAFTVQ